MTTRTNVLVRRACSSGILLAWFLLLFCPIASAAFGFMAGGLENRDEAKMAALLQWWDGVRVFPDIHWWMRSNVFTAMLLGMTILTLLYLFWGRGRLRDLYQQAMEGKCGSCAYDLCGHVDQNSSKAGRCPECGTSIVAH